MKKSIKFFALLLTVILSCFCIFSSAFASSTIPSPTPEFYVNDFAKVFSAEEKASLMNKAVSLANEHNGIQVVISTITSLNGDTVENYANEMYNKYGIGKDDMGLLILLSTGDRKIRVEVGKSMETYINDSKAGRFMQNYAIPYLKENKFNEGLINLQEALISEIITCVSSEAEVQNTSTSESSVNAESSINFFAFLAVLAVILFIALVIFIITLIIKKAKERKKVILELNNRIEFLKREKRSVIRSHTEEKNTLNDKISNLQQETENLKSTLNISQSELAALNDRYSRVLKIYPDADSKVDDMIKAEIIEKDKKAANNVDTVIASVITLSASKDIVDKLEHALSIYSSLSANQKKYVTSDIEKLNKLYSDSDKLKRDYERKLEEERIRKETEARKNKAADVSSKILSIISLITIAKASDLSELTDAKELYDDLDYKTQKYVDSSVISKLDSLLRAAKHDKEEEEEEERRRMYSTYHSSDSFSSNFNDSGSSFGGFGGDSGGGGASADF